MKGSGTQGYNPVSPNLQTCEQRLDHRKSIFKTTQARIDAQPGEFCGGVFLVCVKGGEKTKGEKAKGNTETMTDRESDRKLKGSGKWMSMHF